MKIDDEFEEAFGHKIPTRKVVCPRCDGNGTHVNPAIDGHGIGADDECWADDDFREGYFSGRYDVTCHECRGANVVDQVRYEALSFEETRFVDEWVDADWEYEQMVAAERRFGC